MLPWLRVDNRQEGDLRFNDVTVRDLLDMTSGIDAPESYQASALLDPNRLLSNLTGTILLFVTPDVRSYALSHRRMAFTPGTAGEYVSYNTQLLSMVVSEVLGSDFVRLFVRRLWNRAGAQFPATWNLDHSGGIAKAFCCLNATARDFARLGLLVEEAGRTRPVARTWRRRLLTPRPHKLAGAGYSTQFWHGPGARAGVRSQDASAIGIFGQYIYIHPRKDVVIVKLSDHGIEQDEELTFRAMRSIARSF